MKPSIQDLNEAARLDLLADAEHAEAQAARGEFYPDHNVTRGTLLRYAAECRAKANRSDTHAAALET